MWSTAPNPGSSADAAEAKRNLIYGALMLYGAETIPLRERALDSAVLASLIGTTTDKPLKNGEIRVILRNGIGNIDLRQEIILETLNRLTTLGLIQVREERKKSLYYLSENGKLQIEKSSGKADSIFDAALTEILTHADEALDRAVAASVFAHFICASFARFGSSIAAYLTGRHARLGNATELAVTFDEAAEKFGVTGTTRDSLRARSLGIFRSKSSAATRLMFHLTQGYCFVQLLGIDRNGFDPITEEAFRESVFYLDTNILFAGLLSRDHGAAFAEVLGIARRVGSELRVTRATIDETRAAAADKLNTLEKISEMVPKEVAALSGDELISHFYEEREKNPELTPAEFFADFGHIAEVVRDRWHLVLEELTESTILQGVVTKPVEDIIQAASIHARGFKKGERVLAHDVAAFILVERVRAERPKTWFLTRDKALIAAAPGLAKLAGKEEKPFCFGMLGFLQSISPFVSSATEEDSLADFFASLLTEQLFISEKLFDGQELALIAETHADVMAMPPDQVVMAVDYVKKHILKGQRYRTDTVPIVALELRKYLSANNDDRQRALEAVASENAASYQEAKRAMASERARNEEYQAKLRAMEDELAESKSLSVSKQEQLQMLEDIARSRNVRDRRILLVLVAAVLIAFALLLGHFANRMIPRIAAHTTLASSKIATILQLLKYGILLFPCILAVRNMKIGTSIKGALVAVIVICWFFLAGIQRSETIGVMSNLATVALFLALFFPNRWREESRE